MARKRKDWRTIRVTGARWRALNRQAELQKVSVSSVAEDHFLIVDALVGETQEPNYNPDRNEIGG